MPAELASWPRPLFTPGGGNPFLFYVVFGAFDLARPLGRARYRSSGVPDWLELVPCNRSEQPDVFADYQCGPVW